MNKKYFLSLCVFQTLITVAANIYADPIGYSGMEQINDHSYLVVHDKKNYQNGARLGIINIQVKSMPIYQPVKINDWKHKDGQASDLESVCSIPNKPGEFLVSEAGYWEGKYGRIFHISLHGEKAKVVNVFQLPMLKGSTEKAPHGDNFEGLECVVKGNSLLVIVGERGGSRLYKNGFLRIGILDHKKSSLTWDKFKNNSIEIVAPGTWNNPNKKRSISDLHVDANNVIWAVATEDKSNEGPFRSVIYKAALISDTDNFAPVKAITNNKVSWTIDGYKVESISGATSLINGSYMSFATEDESYPGSWRPLFFPVD